MEEGAGKAHTDVLKEAQIRSSVLQTQSCTQSVRVELVKCVVVQVNAVSLCVCGCVSSPALG